MPSSWIEAAVFKTTVGLLVNEGRDVVAETLIKHGGVAEQQLRKLLVSEINYLKASARKDLKVSLIFFKEGIGFMDQLFDQTTSGEVGVVTRTSGRPRIRTPRTVLEKLAVNLKLSSGGLNGSANTNHFVKGLENVNLTDLDESAKRTLYNAKKRFEGARIEATKAFANDSLEISDRILAKKIRVMATLLQEVDNPASALAACRVSLEELHALPVVRDSFNFQEGFYRSLFNQLKRVKDERKKIVADVCHVNFVIYSVTNIVGKGGDDLSDWPSIGVGHENVDPLRDHRVAKILRKLNVEHYCLVYSFKTKEGSSVEKEETNGKDGERSERRGEWGERKGKTTFSPPVLLRLTLLAGRFLALFPRILPLTIKRRALQALKREKRV